MAVDGGLFIAGYNLSFLALCSGPSNGLHAPSVLVQRALLALWASLFCYYQARALSRSGQTIGKKLLGLRVIDENGDAPAFGAAFARALGYIASSTFLNLGFFWAAWEKDAKTWHDLLAGTRVIETRPKGLWQRRLQFGLAALLAGTVAAVELKHAFQ